MTPSTIPDAEVPAALAAAYPELRVTCETARQQEVFDGGNAWKVKPCPGAECDWCQSHDVVGTGYLPMTGPEAVSAMLALAGDAFEEVTLWKSDAGWVVLLVGREKGSDVSGKGSPTLELALGRALLLVKER